MAHQFHPTSLREYDIRGVVGKTLGEADAYALGRSFGTLVRRAGGTKVAVGRDGRESSSAMEAALVRGLTESGADAVRVGLGPTPMLYYAAAELGVDGGIMITGSHNPADYNGFKMVLGGNAFFGADIQKVGGMAAEGDWEIIVNRSITQWGHESRYTDAVKAQERPPAQIERPPGFPVDEAAQLLGEEPKRAQYAQMGHESFKNAGRAGGTGLARGRDHRPTTGLVLHTAARRRTHGLLQVPRRVRPAVDGGARAPAP